MENSKEKTIDDLTDKLIFEIFCFCDYDSFLTASQVCVRWNRVVSDNIDFFSSYFEDKESPEEEVTEETKEPENDKPYSEEQEAIVEQLTTLDLRKQYHEMLGVATGAEEDDIRNQYKKLALLVHPDKNKAPGAMKAFQALKKAFDVVLCGVDVDDKNTAKVDCPNKECGSTVYLKKEHFHDIMKAIDIGFCKACKSRFGRIFCPHCFSSELVQMIEEKQGTITQCEKCRKNYAIMYPRPQAKRPAPPPKTQQKKAPVVKKQKKNWWEQQ